jgi:hypothetical protein
VPHASLIAASPEGFLPPADLNGVNRGNGFANRHGIGFCLPISVGSISIGDALKLWP